MSGRSGSMPPRACPAPERPPVESCTIMPGQCVSHAVLQPGKSIGIRCRPPLVVPDVAMNDARARLERLVRALDLLPDGDRNGGIVGLGRQRSRDRDADDARAARQRCLRAFGTRSARRSTARAWNGQPLTVPSGKSGSKPPAGGCRLPITSPGALSQTGFHARAPARPHRLCGGGQPTVAGPADLNLNSTTSGPSHAGQPIPIDVFGHLLYR